MACAFHVNPDHQFVLLRPAGEFTESEFIALSKAVWTHPDREPHFTHLWDTRPIEKLVMNASVIPMYRTFRAEHEEQETVGKVAIVTTRPNVRTFALMIVQIGKLDRLTLQPFSNMEAAAGWADLPLRVLTEIPDAQWITP
ncbi:MAG TPA: hypothetical protein VJ884_04810 [Salinibacter sp.]|nr:hypothetical protein [Salinibacter sp.]